MPEDGKAPDETFERAVTKDDLHTEYAPMKSNVPLEGVPQDQIDQD